MTRIGVIGTGGIARRHVQELIDIGDVAVTAVVDLDEERTRWVTELTGARYYPRVQDLLPHVDAAYVLTPPRARVDAIRVLAEAGKAIFCEKPLAASVEDARRIHEIVSATDVPFMMGFMRRWHPAYRSLRSLIDEERIGRPLQYFRQRLGHLPQPQGNWRVDPGQMCGLTVESASHDIDLLRWLGGDVVAASGQVLESHPDLPGFDDTVNATLRFANGAIGMLQVTWASHVSQNQVGVIGDRAAAVISGTGMWRSERLTISGPGSSETAPRRFSAAEGENEGYDGQTRTFIGLVRGEAQPHPGIADGLATVDLSHQILSSSSPRSSSP